MWCLLRGPGAGCWAEHEIQRRAAAGQLSSQGQRQCAGMCRKMACCTVKLFCTYSISGQGMGGVLEATLVWAVLTTKAVLLGGEANAPNPWATLLEVQPSDLDLCLVLCLGM